MKIYQLVAHGSLVTFSDSYKLHSKTVYKSQKQARMAIVEFKKLVTAPRNKYDLTVMEKKNLHVIIVPLELVENKKEENNGNTNKE